MNGLKIVVKPEIHLSKELTEGEIKRYRSVAHRLAIMQFQKEMNNPYHYLHIECKLQLGFSVRVIYFEQSVDKFLQVDVAAGVEIEH